MEMPTLPEEVIQMDGHNNDCTQGEVVILAGQFHLDLLAQTSSKLSSRLIPQLELKQMLTSLSALCRIIKNKFKQSHEPLIRLKRLLASLPDSCSPFQYTPSEHRNNRGNLRLLGGGSSHMMCEIEGALKEEATAFGWCPVIFLQE
jgi:hypothetical protein